MAFFVYGETKMIENPDVKASKTLYYSNQFIDGAELVLVAGYTESGKFGYFITYERNLTNEIQYENTIKSIVKENEESFKEILKDFKELMI